MLRLRTRSIFTLISFFFEFVLLSIETYTKKTMKRNDRASFSCFCRRLFFLKSRFRALAVTLRCPTATPHCPTCDFSAKILQCSTAENHPRKSSLCESSFGISGPLCGCVCPINQECTVVRMGGVHIIIIHVRLPVRHLGRLRCDPDCALSAYFGLTLSIFVNEFDFSYDVDD